MTKLLTTEEIIDFLEYNEPYCFMSLCYGVVYYDSENKIFRAENADVEWDLFNDKWDGFAIHGQYLFGWEKGWFENDKLPHEMSIDDITYESATMVLIVLQVDNWFERTFINNKD